VKELIQKTWFNIQRRGFFTLVFISIFKSIQKVIPFELLLFFERSLQNPISELDPGIDISFQQGQLADLKKLDAKEYRFSGVEFYEINNACDFFIGTSDKVVFYVWVSYSNIFDDRIFDIALSSKQAYLYRAFTHPDYRGLKIYPAGLSYVCQELQKQHIEKCFIAASIENRSSINGILNAGFTKIGYVMYFKVHNYKKVILPKILQSLATQN